MANKRGLSIVTQMASDKEKVEKYLKSEGKLPKPKDVKFLKPFRVIKKQR